MFVVCRFFPVGPRKRRPRVAAQTSRVGARPEPRGLPTPPRGGRRSLTGADEETVLMRRRQGLRKRPSLAVPVEKGAAVVEALLRRGDGEAVDGGPGDGDAADENEEASPHESSST